MYNPLVSVTVITYNSGKTVIETLDSIKEQTYQNIELIISDDCSKDNTIQLCKEWLKENESRFVRTVLIESEKNTGICANGNRALWECRGEWNKGIAGDDIFLPNCVQDFVEFVCEHTEAKWVSSYARTYAKYFKEENCTKRFVAPPMDFFSLSAEEQLVRMGSWNIFVAASNFFETAMLKEIGGYDESYSFEDYPLFITLLERGRKCYFLDKETCCYRIHDSVFNSNKQLFNYKFLLQSRKFHEERCFKYCTKKQIFGQKMIWRIQDVMQHLSLNKKIKWIEKPYNAIYYVVNKLTDNM